MTPELAMHTGLSATPVTQAGYGFSLSDVARFEASMRAAETAAGSSRLGAVDPLPETAGVQIEGIGSMMEAVMKPFEYINRQGSELEAQVQDATAGDRELTPGEMVMLTMRSQQFMFNCQLTSNIANRTSDGLQQLFRQQA